MNAVVVLGALAADVVRRAVAVNGYSEAIQYRSLDRTGWV